MHQQSFSTTAAKLEEDFMHKITNILYREGWTMQTDRQADFSIPPNTYLFCSVRKKACNYLDIVKQ